VWQAPTHWHCKSQESSQWSALVHMHVSGGAGGSRSIGRATASPHGSHAQASYAMCICTAMKLAIIGPPCAFLTP
jgi:hypothetical protein